MLPFRNDSNDARILTVAANLASEGKLVTLVSKDIPLRVKAGAVGLDADEYHAQDVVTSGVEQRVGKLVAELRGLVQLAGDAVTDHLAAVGMSEQSGDDEPVTVDPTIRGVARDYSTTMFQLCS